MKKIYFCLLLAFTLVVSGQEITDFQKQKNDEIVGFKLYPNPAYDDIVYVTTKYNNRKEIVVYDVFGEVVLTDRISTNVLNISRLVPGVYVLQVTEDKKSITRKLVVK
ncbi:MAG: hypothetical protein COC08_02705 [Maribacter sp.]|nr:MAG: hypothetical protein COC08_02705 [Maribacter sp.]